MLICGCSHHSQLIVFRLNKHTNLAPSPGVNLNAKSEPSPRRSENVQRNSNENASLLFISLNLYYVSHRVTVFMHNDTETPWYMYKKIVICFLHWKCPSPVVSHIKIHPQIWLEMFWLVNNAWLCRLLQCFYQLFGLSFWRHPFTAEDPLVSKRWNATFLQICSHEETNSSTSWMSWGWVNDQQMYFFWVNSSFKLVFSLIKSNLSYVFEALTVC